MMSFVATKRVHTALAAGGLLLTQASGCYKNTTADEDLIDLPGTDESRDGAISYQDAAVADSTAPASNCAGSDPIAQLFCTLLPQTTPTPTATTTPAATSDIAGLLDTLGGLGNIASILNTVLGGGTTAARPGTTTDQGLVGLINLAGGLGNIAALLNGLLGGQSTQAAQPSLADLFASFAGQQQQGAAPAALPTIADILTSLGIPVANSPMVTAEPTEADCSNPATQAIAFVCALQDANTPPAQ